MPPDPPQPGVPDPPGQGASTLAALAALVPLGLKAAAGALGLVGFVAVIGAAITWVRFYAARLPADQAVAAIPKTELVVIGAAALTFYLILGAVAVVVVYLIDRRGRATKRMKRGIFVLVVIGMWAAIVQAREVDDDLRTGIAVGVLLAAVVTAVRVEALEGHSPTVARLLRWLQTPGPGCGIVGAILGRRFNTIAVRLLVLVVLGEVALLAWLSSTNATSLALVLAAAMGLGAICVGVARGTGDRFPLYGVTVFLALVLFGGILNAMRVFLTPVMQPSAVVLKGRPAGLEAIYVTETDKRLYLATVERLCDTDASGKVLGSNRVVPGSGRIFWLDRNLIASYAVGPQQPIADLAARATAARRQLEVMRPVFIAPKPATAPSTTARARARRPPLRSTRRTTPRRRSPPSPQAPRGRAPSASSLSATGTAVLDPCR